jgi:hypothetical protein
VHDEVIVTESGCADVGLLFFDTPDGAMMFRDGIIPAFLSIDVEPDAFQISADQTDHWPGYAATYPFIASLRSELERASGAKPVFGWYYRIDPQIEQVCGRADFAMAAFPERMAALRAEGDYFGAHAHPLRWCRERRAWVHDFGDSEWLRDCTQFALDAFAASTGSPTALFRSGAGFVSNEIVDVLDRNGVAAEMGLEPVAGWGLTTTTVSSGVDKSPMVGAYTNCATAPRTPYHPSPEDFRKTDADTARRILLVPVSTGVGVLPSRGLAWIKRRLRRGVEPGRESEPIRVLYPTEDDWTERGFWDLVSHQLRSMERPYVSLGIRTDRFDSIRASRVCRVLRELTRHPLVKRLRFVSPLEAMEHIAPQRKRPRAPVGH